MQHKHVFHGAAALFVDGLAGVTIISRGVDADLASGVFEHAGDECGRAGFAIGARDHDDFNSFGWKTEADVGSDRHEEVIYIQNRLPDLSGQQAFQ